MRKKHRVVFDAKPNAAYVGDEKLFRINGRTNLKQQLFMLLHECGHYLIGYPESHERFGHGYPASDPGEKRQFLHRVDVVDEEMEAWHRGRRLASRLKIKIDLVEYNKLRAQMLKTHLKWALRVDGYGGKAGNDEENT